MGSLESQASLRASRRAFIVIALLFSSPPATRAAGSAVRLRTTLSWATVAMADDEESFGSDDDLHHSSDPSSEEEDEDREVLPRILPRRGPLRGANGWRTSSLNGAAPVRTGVLPLPRLEQIQSNRKSALMHTGVLSVLLDAGGVPKIRAVITSVRSSG